MAHLIWSMVMGGGGKKDLANSLLFSWLVIVSMLDPSGLVLTNVGIQVLLPS